MQDLQPSAESQASWKRSTASSFRGPKETEQIHPHERGGQIFRGLCVLKARPGWSGGEIGVGVGEGGGGGGSPNAANAWRDVCEAAEWWDICYLLR